MDADKIPNSAVSFLSGGQTSLGNLTQLRKLSRSAGGGGEYEERITSLCQYIAANEFVLVTEASEIKTLVYLRDVYGFKGAALVIQNGGPEDLVEQIEAVRISVITVMKRHIKPVNTVVPLTAAAGGSGSVPAGNPPPEVVPLPLSAAGGSGPPPGDVSLTAAAAGGSEPAGNHPPPPSVVENMAVLLPVPMVLPPPAGNPNPNAGYHSDESVMGQIQSGSGDDSGESMGLVPAGYNSDESVMGQIQYGSGDSMGVVPAVGTQSDESDDTIMGGIQSGSDDTEGSVKLLQDLNLTASESSSPSP